MDHLPRKVAGAHGHGRSSGRRDGGSDRTSADADQLQLVLDTVDEGILLASKTREIIAVNRRVEEMWGYPARKLVGKKLQYLMSVEAQDASVWSHVEGGTGEQRQLNLEGYRADGSSFPLAVRITRAEVAGEVRFTIAVSDLGEIGRLRERARELEEALERMPVGVAISDLGGRLRYANEALAALHGTEPEALAGRTVGELLPPELAAAIELRELARTGSWRREGEIIPGGEEDGGEPLAVEVIPDVVTGPDGDPNAIVTIVQDIRERRRAEVALRKSEERYALAVRGASDGLWDWDLESGEIYLSPRWKSMLGLVEEDIGSDPEEWLQRVHPEDREPLTAAIRDHLAGRQHHLEHEHRVMARDGSYRWMLTRGIAVWDSDGVPTRMAGSQTDITDRKVNDPLTGLPNRTLFMDRLASALGRAKRNDEGFALLFLDLDRFKVVNDSLGHRIGDELLIAVAERVEVCVGELDTLARLGGDELAILAEGSAKVEQAVALAQRVQGRLAAPFEIEGHEIFTTPSIGIVMAFPDYGSAEELVRDADTALSRAKSLGRARHEVFNQGMRERAVAQLKLETDLRKAVSRDELELHYQPIVRMGDNRIEGFEALLRWNHPELGQLLPIDFIPLAEETGLILPIGIWVLERACIQIRSWQDEVELEPPLTMSVNLSAKQFAQHDLLDQVRQVMAETGIDARCLRLEITESAVIEHPDEAVRTLEALRALGVKVSIDDFGTGYSSLSYLHRYPIDTLKIDRSFISQLGVETKPTELVRAILRLAEDLGVGVVAEGVETDEQLASLQQLSCESMQGYCFSRPVDRESARRMLLEHGRAMVGDLKTAMPGGQHSSKETS